MEAARPAAQRRWIATGAMTAALTVAAVAGSTLAPIMIEVGGAPWRRAVRGPTLEGVLHPGAPAVVLLPSLARHRPRELTLAGAGAAGGAATLVIRVDGGEPIVQALSDARTARIVVPTSARRGLRIDLQVMRGTPSARLHSVGCSGSWPPVLTTALLALLAAVATVGTAATEGLSTRGGFALGLVAAGWAGLGMAILGSTGLVLAGASAAVPATASLALVGIVIGVLARRGAHAAFARAAALVIAFAAGGIVRALFLPTPGSWDMEYWRAWTAQAIAVGTTQAYGASPGAGHVLPQLRGQEPVEMVTFEGRRFPIDYPPLALLAWRVSVAVVDGPNAPVPSNAALKLPAIVGDLLAVAVVLWAARRRARDAVRLAAAYWALPVSWLSSATLGYLDGASAPLVLLSAIAAGRAQPVAAGVWLASAALVKPTALVAAPAIAAAIGAGRPLSRALAAGLAVVAVVLTPYLLTGTLTAAVVHVARIVFQERLSGGYANAWWVLGHLVAGESGQVVPYVRLSAVPFPLGAVGILAFLACAIVIGRALARARAERSTVAAAGALFAAYAAFAVGVHVNHVHAMALLLMAAGLIRTPWGPPTAVLLTTYVLNMLLLEGQGRTSGPELAALDPLIGGIDHSRLAGGFDLTLALAGVNVAALALMLARARPALDALSASGRREGDVR